jgi:outer membrane immunogenic protein
MKRLTLAIAMCAIFGGLAYAGPEAFSGKEMKEVAPPPPPPPRFNWSGFYIGGFGGYKYSSVDLNLDLSGEWNGAPGPRDMVESEGSGNLNNSGAELGGLVGYNYQWNCWVLGLEVDGGYLWARDSSNSGIFFPSQFQPVDVRSSFKTHYLVTVAPRFGYAFGRWLPYVTGGLAVGDLEYAQEIAFPGGGPTDREGASRTNTNPGWMVGGGLQYALSDHWSVRAQYQYIDLGSISFESDFDGGGIAPAYHHAELREHNASFAIMYKF